MIHQFFCITFLFVESLFAMQAIEKNGSLFGTDGIRKTMGQAPMTHNSLPKLGRAIAAWAEKKYGAEPTILIAQDTRQSCSYVKASLCSGLLLSPVKLYDAFVLPTPAVHQLIKKINSLFDCAIIISASHNTYRDNGIKIIDARTNKISLEDEVLISQLMHEDDLAIDYAQCGQYQPFLEATSYYCDLVTRHFPPLFLENKTIVLDCANGATSQIAPLLFSHLGAKVITINNAPTGININESCGAVHPEQLQQAVLKHNALAGFAFDGDGDRIIAVNQQGKIIDGDEILALLSNHPRYKNCSSIVGTTMSNQGFEQYLRTQNKKLVRAQVGDKYVEQQMQNHNSLLGGEPSGHIIIRDYLESSDGIFAALLLLETMHLTNNWSMTSFEKFPQVLINVPIQCKKDLTDPIFVKIISSYEELVPLGRLLVRYSGTENVLRVMVEDSTYEHAHTIATELSEKLRTLLQ